MAETIERHTLGYRRRLDRKLDAMAGEQRTLRNDYRRVAETLVALSRSIDHMCEIFVGMLKAEIGGFLRIWRHGSSIASTMRSRLGSAARSLILLAFWAIFYAVYWSVTPR
jgi:hypothetical protein